MASSNFTIDVIGNDSEQPIESGAPYKTVNNVINYLAGVVSGCRLGNVSLACRASAVAATGTATIAGAIAADTFTVTINGVAVGPTVYVTSNTATAAAVAAAINASVNTLVSGHVTATSALGVVTVTAKNPGVSGNAVTLSASKTGTGTITASGARLTGGTETLSTFNF